MATYVYTGTTSTSFGSAPGADSVTAIYAGANNSRAIGGLCTVFLGNAPSVAQSQTDLVKAEFKAPAKMRIKSITHGNEAITGTSSFNVYNVTDTAAILGAQTLTSAAEATVTSFSAAGRNVIDKGDVIQIRCTTAAASTITSLNVWALVEFIGDPDNN
jgi:hypothetical protein